MNILGIDPGLNCTGLAWRMDDKLKVTDVKPRSRGVRDKVREIVLTIPDICWDYVVVECMQVYARDVHKRDPNDLIQVAILSGGLISLIPSYHVVMPTAHMWKGQVRKAVHHKRLRALETLPDKLSLDALDAFGILLYGEKVVAAQQAARRNKRAM